MNKKLLITLCLLSSFAYANKHDSSIDFRGLQDECEDATLQASTLLNSNRIAFVINASCEYLENSSIQEARFTMIDAKLVATSYDVSGTSNKCDQNIQASLQSLRNAGKVAFMTHACDFVDGSSTMRTGAITVISEYESQLISR